MGINADLIYGTRPDSQYMKKKSIDTSYIDNKAYLMQIPQLFHHRLKVKSVEQVEVQRGGGVGISYNAQTNINININNNGIIKEEKQPLLDGFNEDGIAEKKVNDSEGTCCRCVVL